MQKDLENSPTVGKSADSISESADSSKRNYTHSLSSRPDFIKKLHEKQKEFEEKEQEVADQDLDAELNTISDKEITLDDLPEFLSIHFLNNYVAEKLAKDYLHEYKSVSRPVTELQLSEYISNNLDSDQNISLADSAILQKEKLIAEGKSQEEILKILIATYKNEPELKTFVENWRKFLELWVFAQDKPATERKAIEAIISTANFTTANSFAHVLTEIEDSSKISVQTKLDIHRKFKTSGINTVRDFDRTLKKERQYKKSIEKKIQTKSTDIENLNDEISNLNVELNELSRNDPKRAELEAKIKEKNELLKTYKQDFFILERAKPNKVQFLLRNDLIAKLNPDGTRSVRIESEDFTIQLPSNRYPLQGEKNLRSINVAFPFLALRSLHISNEIFAPDLMDNGVPTKAQRNMAHLIISSLGIDDSQVLSEKEIALLKNDLSHLVNTTSGKIGRKSLIELKIYDVASQNVNRKQFKKALHYIRENRNNERSFQKLKDYLK